MGDAFTGWTGEQLHNPGYWRELAEEARKLALETDNSALGEIAARYDRLAQLAEQSQIKGDPLPSLTRQIN